MSIDTSFLATGRAPSNVVFDLDGVLVLGTTTIPGAAEALTRLADADVHVVFATNNATKTVDQIHDRISTLTGAEPPLENITSSATATATLLETTDDPILVVGESGLRSTLEAAGRTLTTDPEEARTVVVALDRSLDYDTIERASRAVRSGARFIATNLDATFPTPTGPVPGAGTLVQAVATASGATPEVTGKPSPAMIRHVRSRLRPGGTWMVGDRPETDLAFGRRAGWLTVLTLTGVTSSIEEVPQHLQPDLVIPSVAEIASAFDHTSTDRA